MGTHGSSGIQAIAGSNASRVIALAPCPVITVREKTLGQGYKNIVLPLDLSSETKQKVHIASMVAKYFNSTVHIVTLDPKDEFLANRVQNNLRQVEDYLKERNIQFTETRLSESNGSFGKQTLTWAEGKDADLIIIMAETERGVSDFIFGSYAQQIVNRSPIPVMTVNPRNNMAGFDIINLTS
jgi:nucleotide-binding universal stress UspA family protein